MNGRAGMLGVQLEIQLRMVALQARRRACTEGARGLLLGWFGQWG
jgi:hypothetical protein